MGDWFFVGEAPGEDEDKSLIPFVGKAGRRFNALLEREAGLARTSVFVTNVERHRPPGNRTPHKREITACLDDLREELLRVRPKYIVAMGAKAIAAFKPGVKLKGAHGKASPLVNALGTGLSVSVSDAQRLQQEVAGTVPVPTNYTLGLESIGLEGVKQIGFDTETTSPQRGGVFQTGEAELVGYSIATERGRAAYVPFGKFFDNGRDSIQVAGSLEGLKGIVEDQAVSKVCHNGKFEYKVLSKQGMVLANFHDTKLAAYLLGEYSTTLKDLTRQHLGTEPITYDQLTQGRGMETINPYDILPYAAADADNTLALWKLFERRLRSEGLWDVYEKIEIPLVPVLAEMEMLGVRVDREAAMRLLEALKETHETNKALLVLLLGIDNPMSHDKLARALEVAGAPLLYRTPSKNLLVTSASVLKGARSWNSTIIDSILEMRKFQKLASYVDGFLKLSDDAGHLHASFNQAGAWEERGEDGKSAPATGRLSSSGPNLQNIPHHSDPVLGKKLRSLILPREGHLFLACDLEQEEPRIIALVAQDGTLQEAFANKRDIYRKATEAIYPHTRSELDDKSWKAEYGEERYKGKTIFLAWYYGAGANRIRDIEPTVSDAGAQAIIKRLRTAHPARERYVAKIAREVKGDGFVKTWFGMKRWLPTAMSHNKGDVEAAVREACNMPIQGTAADVLKMAMRRVRDGLMDTDSKLCMTIHDEVVVDVLPEEVDKVREVVYSSFQGLLPIELPIEFKVGASLGEVA